MVSRGGRVWKGHETNRKRKKEGGRRGGTGVNPGGGLPRKKGNIEETAIPMVETVQGFVLIAYCILILGRI